MADKKQQESTPDKRKKSGTKQDWVEQSGKNPDDMEIFTQPKKL